MSQAPSEEIVVYGDAPDSGGGGGGGTDVLSIPVDYLTYYMPAGPTVINPPPPTETGGGDTPPSGEEAAYWAAVGLAIVAMIPGAGEVEIAVGVSVKLAAQVGAVLAGATGHQLHNAGEKPPNKKYRGPQGAPARATSLSPAATTYLAPWLAADQSVREMSEAVRCAQGAFLAGDVEWTQRTAVLGSQAWIRTGPALKDLADAADELLARAERTPSGSVPTGDVLEVLEAGAGRVSCPELDQVKRAVVRLLGRATPPDPTAGLRELEERMADPHLVKVRFAFPRPVGSRHESELVREGAR